VVARLDPIVLNDNCRREVISVGIAMKIVEFLKLRIAEWAKW
jgi:hypothetical protein